MIIDTKCKIYKYISLFQYYVITNMIINQWVDFVNEDAKDNNISYGCAISEAGPVYQKMKQGGN